MQPTTANKTKKIDSLAGEISIADQTRQALQQDLDRMFAEQNESVSRLVVERDAERAMKVQLEQANQDLELRMQAERRDAACAMTLHAKRANLELEGLQQELQRTLVRLSANQEMHESLLSGLTEALGRQEAENKCLVDRVRCLTLERDEADRRVLDAETNMAKMARRIRFHRAFTGDRAWSSRRLAWLTPALLSLARTAARRKHYNVAKAAYRVLLGISPTHWRSWVQYGHMLKWGGDYALAEGAYREAIELSPTQADSFLQLGHVLKLQGFTVDAIEAYTTALKLHPNLDYARQEMLSFRMSTAQPSPSYSSA